MNNLTEYQKNNIILEQILSPDVLGEIVLYLDKYEVIALSRTCKSFNEALNGKYVLKVISAFPFKSIYQRVEAIVENATFKKFFNGTVPTPTKKVHIPELLSLSQLHYLEQCNLCDIIKSYKEPVPKDIQALFDSGKDNIQKLREYMEARDTIVIWNKIFLAGLKTCSPPFISSFPARLNYNFWSSSDTVLNTAKEYPAWCNSHLEELSRITELDFSDCQLTHTPDVRNFPALQYLYFDKNLLTQAPDVSSCSRLLLLNLENNQLIQAPDVSNCPKLEVLNLDDNPFSSPAVPPAVPPVVSSSGTSRWVILSSALTLGTIAVAAYVNPTEFWSMVDAIQGIVADFF